MFFARESAPAATTQGVDKATECYKLMWLSVAQRGTLGL